MLLILVLLVTCIVDSFMCYVKGKNFDTFMIFKAELAARETFERGPTTNVLLDWPFREFALIFMIPKHVSCHGGSLCGFAMKQLSS